MFLDELTPVFQTLVQNPMAFLGGFCSGALRLNLYDDPVKSWLDQQGHSGSASPFGTTDGHNGRSRPQSIEID